MRNLATLVILLLALLPAARLNAGEAADVPAEPETKEEKESKEAAAAKELSEDDKRAAAELVKGLADEAFDVRKASLEKIRALVFADKTKARAWDAWLEATRKATQEPEVQFQLPRNVELLGRYVGRYKMVGDQADEGQEMEITPDYKLWIFTNSGTQAVVAGTFGFDENGKLVIAGNFSASPDVNPISFTMTGSREGDTLKSYLKVLDSEEIPYSWVIMPKKMPAPAKAEDSGKPAGDAAKKEP